MRKGKDGKFWHIAKFFFPPLTRKLKEGKRVGRGGSCSDELLRQIGGFVISGGGRLLNKWSS